MTYIESRGALQKVTAVLKIAEEINYDVHYRYDKCIEELRKRRNACRNIRIGWKTMEHMPCGMQDAYGERMEATYWNFWVYLDAMRVAKGKMPQSMLLAWKNAIGEI